ncbi:hypothetical protein LOD99_10149 [Oopsacas minuta]|uniref:Uncharacterized protein n=1 Tax=Oopsacas minuta TaxID=111878 RepID=A0AAV7KJQ2_9METZ|nr:hypothetical protein LOD99_10149 [Oopsacas minuta]
MRIYLLYLSKKSTNVHPLIYLQALKSLKETLANVNPDTQLKNTDDRVPTMYFKVKTYKASFSTSTTQYPEIYTCTHSSQDLVDICRPIVNHKNTITSSISKIIRTLLTPTIETRPYLTQDLFETIKELRRPGAPEHIYTADNEAFYPNTPHPLVLRAFDFFVPTRKKELQLLKQLLTFNFTSNGRRWHPNGPTSCARTCTLVDCLTT